MRIDPNGMIGGCPALVVRKALRHVRVWDQWGVAELEAAAALPQGTGRDLVKALQTEGLIEASACAPGPLLRRDGGFRLHRRPSRSHGRPRRKRWLNSLIESSGSTVTRISWGRQFEWFFSETCSNPMLC